MADTPINASVLATTEFRGVHQSPTYWLSALVGAVIYIDANSDLSASKTTDGGATWGSPVVLEAGNVTGLETFFDRMIPGDTGTKAHAAYIDNTATSFRYAAFDINAGTWSTPVEVDANGAGAVGASSTFIAKTRAGGFWAGWCNNATASGAFKSDDGVTWAAAASPWESNAADLARGTYCSTDDTKDARIVFGDLSATELTVKTLDDSGASVSESTAIAVCHFTGTQNPCDFGVRLSDGATIVISWNANDAATADLVWARVPASASPTPVALTNVLTDAAESGVCGVFIDQTNDDLYACYASGSAFTGSVTAKYKKSTDDGSTLGAEVAYSSGEVDIRVIRGGHMGPASGGGRFQPNMFVNAANDLTINLDNDIEIAAIINPTVASVAPPTGSTAGGTTVVVTGTGFLAGAQVTFGGSAATGEVVDSSTQITCVTPAHAAGAVDVVVTNTDTGFGTLASGYTYVVPPVGSLGGSALPSIPTMGDAK